MNIRQKFQSLRQVYRSHFYIFLFYCFSHGLVALSASGIWWDDWVLFYNSDETIRNSFKQSGVFPPYVGDLHVLLTSMGPVSYRAVTFVCFLISSWNFFALIKRFIRCTEQHALLLTILFTILPFNLARIAGIDLPYTISLTLFLIAWRIYPKNLALSLLCFFVSYLTQSLLLFMLVVFLVEFSVNSKSKMSKRVIFKLSSLLALPVIYWLIKNIFFKPYGDYEGYNQDISVLNLFNPIKIVFLDLLNFRTSFPLTLILFLVTYLVVDRIDIMSLKQEERIKWAFFGLFTLVIGVLPYLLLGLTPTFRDWNSRHQLLMPFGASLFIGGLVIGRSRIHKIALALVISVSLSFTSMNYLAFSKDWEKQRGIIEGIRNSLLIDECAVILITDKTNVQNAVGRYYRFYEWNAMFKLSTGKQDRFVISSADVDLFNKGNFDSFYTKEFSAANFKRSEKNIFCAVDIYYQNNLYTLNVERNS
jgi:hypothetical protein